MKNGSDAPYPTLTSFQKPRFRLPAVTAVLGAVVAVASIAIGQTPAPVTDLTVRDHKWDGGDSVVLNWTLSPDDAALIESYFVYKANVEQKAYEYKLSFSFPFLHKVYISDPLPVPDVKWEVADVLPAGTSKCTVGSVPYHSMVRLKELSDTARGLFADGSLPKNEHEQIDLQLGYKFRVVAAGKDGSMSEVAETDTAISPTRQWFDAQRGYLLVIILVFGGSVVFYIQHARAGKDLKIRKIGGLAAVDEAVGRATEMGRSCMFIPGIQDMNDIQTIAGITVLSRVAKTAAEYDAKVEVPTCRSLVMTSAREAVQAAYLGAGRPDSYNPDLIYYVTDEQFGYVAYLQGNMVREKPAACFYMGAFYAESLILAETGNSIGAIQVAGTAMPAQLPFFVAACDYTLIGEEFFAASAYLSGEPEQLGSLKGQDVGKIIVGIGLIIGVSLATLAAILPNVTWLAESANYIKETILK